MNRPENPLLQALLFVLCCVAIFGGFALCTIEGCEVVGLVVLGSGLVVTLAMAEQDGPL